MRIQIGLFFVLLSFASGVYAEALRVSDTLTLTSKAEDLLGGHTRSATTVVSRLLVPPGEGGGQWKITYERMIADDTPIQEAQGRAYSVAVTGGILKVDPIAPTDSVGLESVVQDLESLKPLFEGVPLCEPDANRLCPALVSVLRRFGEPTLKRTESDGALAIQVTTPEGETLEGMARLEPAKWTVELDSLRRETIPFDVEGKGKQEAVAMISGHYTLMRELISVPAAAENPKEEQANGH